MKRLTELTRKHTKAELLRMAYAGAWYATTPPSSGARTRSSPPSWTRSSGPPPGRSRPASRPAPGLSSRQSARRYGTYDECDKTVHEGGARTCHLIEQYGPPSERDDY
ncbi:hypothetical protein ACGFZA_42055 [Streptomyces sp. NPDC048211]|uniref:hypothetical protein n=1 Tax=Streptomyces sp. NPDC048211 TaxID=3365516 RepID=UPI003719CD18